MRAFEYWWYQYRRTWRGTLVSSFLSPVLYLAAMGIGVGSLVDKSGRSAAELGGVGYLSFLAPAVLAGAAMQTAAAEATYPVMAAIKWIRTYHAMLATPLRVIDVLMGHLLWVTVRLVTVCIMFMIVITAFGAVDSWWAVLVPASGILTGLAFAAPIMAFAASRQDDHGFAALFRFGIIPAFLFSGTFFPVRQLPLFLRLVAYVTPLWHGVDLCRSLSLGTASVWACLGHVVYLGALIIAGIWLSGRTFTRRLAE